MATSLEGDNELVSVIEGEPQLTLVEGLMVQETTANNTQQLPVAPTGAAVTTQPPPQPGDTGQPGVSCCCCLSCCVHFKLFIIAVILFKNSK